MSAQPELLAGPAQVQAQAAVPADLEALFNTNDYVDLSALDTAVNTPNIGSGQLPSTGFTPRAASNRGSINTNSNNDMTFENFGEGGQYSNNQNQNQNQAGQTMMGDYMNDSMTGNAMTFDFGQNGVGFGGEMLAGEGMDTVSDGLRGGDQNQGL